MYRQRVILLIIILTFFAPVVLFDYAHFPFSDGAEHGAAVRALAKNLIHPGDPMLNIDKTGSPRYVPSILVMALGMKLLHLHILSTLKLFTILCFALFLASATLFSRSYFGDRKKARWSVVFLLFFWGLGWQEANAYMFSALLASAYYPSVVSFSLALLSLYCQMRYMQRPAAGYLISAIALGAISFINHPLTGIFFFASSGLLYVEKTGFCLRSLLCFISTVAVALCLIALWPYYNFYSVIFKMATGAIGETADYKLTHEYLYSNVLLRTGPALAGIPLIGILIMQKRHMFLWGGFFIFSLLYGAGYFWNISLAERTIFFVMFCLQMTAACFCIEWLFSSKTSAALGLKKTIARVFVVLLTGGVVLQYSLVFKELIAPSFSRAAGSAFPRYVNPNAMQHELKKYLHEGDVVLSEIYSSWSVPVYTGAKIVALYHTAPHITDNEKRIKDVEQFYNFPLTPEQRKRIIAKYGVTHIFLNFIINGKQLVPILKQIGYKSIVCTDASCIFAVE
jgi:hypothetical protein